MGCKFCTFAPYEYGEGDNEICYEAQKVPNTWLNGATENETVSLHGYKNGDYESFDLVVNVDFDWQEPIKWQIGNDQGFYEHPVFVNEELWFPVVYCPWCGRELEIEGA